MPTKPKEAFLIGYFKFFDRIYFGRKITIRGVSPGVRKASKIVFLVLAENDCGGIE